MKGIKGTYDGIVRIKEKSDYQFANSMPDCIKESCLQYGKIRLSDGTIFAERLASIAYCFVSKYQWTIEHSWYASLASIKRMKKSGYTTSEAVDELERQQEETRYSKMETITDRYGNRVQVRKIIKLRTYANETFETIADTDSVELFVIARMNAEKTIDDIQCNDNKSERALTIAKYVTELRVKHNGNYAAFLDANESREFTMFQKNLHRYYGDIVGNRKLSYKEVFYLFMNYWN